MLCAMAAVCLALVALLAPAPAVADEAATIFDPGRMYVIKLTLPPEGETALGKTAAQPNTHPFEYQPGGTFSIAETDGTPDGVGKFSDPVPVEVRLKGSASLRYLDQKSAFKIKFVGTERLRGLRILTLNNMVEDPSMIHETLAYTAFRGSGVPASRTGYAYVYLNGRDYGVHLNIEALDEIALEKLFGSFDPDTQHLYESEYEAEVDPARAWMYEIDEGNDDRSDLDALIEAVNSSGPSSWTERVKAVANLEEMTRMWAVEKYIGQWDGYAGMEASWLPNNYYLYSDPTGRFQMLPWGNDESWQAAYHLPFDGPAGRMFDFCIADEACAAIYRKSVAVVYKAVAGMGLDALAVKTAALLAPWQQMEDEESTREEHSLEEIADGVDETREFIASRPAEAAEWLGEPPQPKATPPGTPQPPGAADPAERAGPPAPSLRLGRMWVEEGVLHTNVRLRSGGAVAQRAKVSTGKRAVVVCRDQAQVKEPRSLTLHCRLPAAVRERLRERPLGLTVATRFIPSGGSPTILSRRIVLPRD